MKPFELIIKIDENGKPAFRFEPKEPHTVAETQQLLRLIIELAGMTPVGQGLPILNREAKDGNDTADGAEV